MTRYIVYFEGHQSTDTVFAPNIESAMDKACDKFFDRVVSHVEEV